MRLFSGRLQESWQKQKTTEQKIAFIVGFVFALWFFSHVLYHGMVDLFGGDSEEKQYLHKAFPL